MFKSKEKKMRKIVEDNLATVESSLQYAKETNNEQYIRDYINQKVILLWFTHTFQKN